MQQNTTRWIIRISRPLFIGSCICRSGGGVSPNGVYNFLFFPFLSDLHWIDTLCNKPLLRRWRALWEISNGVIPREAHWWITTSCVCYCQWVLLFHVEEGRKSVCTHKVQVIITSFTDAQINVMYPELFPYLSIMFIDSQFHVSPPSSLLITYFTGRCDPVMSACKCLWVHVHISGIPIFFNLLGKKKLF